MWVFGRTLTLSAWLIPDRRNPIRQTDSSKEQSNKTHKQRDCVTWTLRKQRRHILFFPKTPQISTDSQTERERERGINIMSSKHYKKQTRQTETKTRQVIIMTNQSLIKKCNLSQMQWSCQGDFLLIGSSLETNVRQANLEVKEGCFQDIDASHSPLMCRSSCDVFCLYADGSPWWTRQPSLNSLRRTSPETQNSSKLQKDLAL